MALDTYGAFNREIEVPLALDYSREPAPVGTALQTDLRRQFAYSRRARKTYRFKGMDAATAQACLAEKKRQYTRKFMGWRKQGAEFLNARQLKGRGIYSLAPADYFAQVATFNVHRNSAAPVFDVQITVDETVVLYSYNEYDPNTAAGQASIEQLFNKKSGTICLWSYVPLYDYDES